MLNIIFFFYYQVLVWYYRYFFLSGFCFFLTPVHLLYLSIESSFDHRSIPKVIFKVQIKGQTQFYIIRIARYSCNLLSFNIFLSVTINYCSYMYVFLKLVWRGIEALTVEAINCKSNMANVPYWFDLNQLST